MAGSIFAPVGKFPPEIEKIMTTVKAASKRGTGFATLPQAWNVFLAAAKSPESTCGFEWEPRADGSVEVAVKRDNDGLITITHVLFDAAKKMLRGCKTTYSGTGKLTQKVLDVMSDEDAAIALYAAMWVAICVVPEKFPLDYWEKLLSKFRLKDVKSGKVDMQKIAEATSAATVEIIDGYLAGGLFPSVPPTGKLRNLPDPSVALDARLEDAGVGVTHVAPASSSKNEEDLSSLKWEGPVGFTPDEVWRIPKIDEKDRNPLAVRMAKKIKFLQDYRVALMNGPAGSGKTYITKMIASLLNVPRRVMTFSANMNESDLWGKFLPKSERTNKNIPAEAENFFAGMTAEDLVFNGDEIAEKVGAASASLLDIFKAFYQKTSSQEAEFEYVPSELIEALTSKNPVVIELQEANMIKDQAVLTSLNDLLQPDTAFVRLPTGEVCPKNPNCVVIFTCNEGYEGARNFNESVLSRMSEVIRVDTPDAAEMKARVIRVTGCKIRDTYLDLMVKVVNEIAAYTRENYISGGSIGFRELRAWVEDVMFETLLNETPISNELIGKSGEFTVLRKVAQTDDESIEAVRTAIWNKYFRT